VTILYLHIGCEKTGSSSIQRFLSMNRERLAQAGILFPSCLGKENQTALTAAAQSEFGPMRRKIYKIRSQEEVEDFRRKVKIDLAREIAAGSYRAGLMSGEHCSSRLLADEEVIWLRNFLQEFFDPVRIVIYIRRQDDFLLSTYSANIRSGGVRTLEIPDDEIVQRRYDYWDLLSRWARVFGRENVICRKFEVGALKNGDIVDDFSEIVSLENASDYARPRRLNQSLDAASLEFLRLFNARVPRLTDQGMNELRGDIAALLSENSSSPLLTLAPDELVQFMDRFTESNRRVAVEYFGGAAETSGDPLFAPSADTRPRTTHLELTVEKTMDICAAIWRLKHAHLQSRQGRLKERPKKVESGGPRR
jgi:hypothetical protein